MPLDDLTTLTERTEGWAAGLRLAAQMLEDCDDAGTLLEHFRGHLDVVAEYFDSEVMAAESASVCRFLTETSVLDEMTPHSCEAVTGTTAAGHLLEDLANRHAFVIRVNAWEPTYRYHHLFSDYLRNRLRRSGQSSIRRTNQRAATWFAAHDNSEAAAHHLVAAGAYDEAFLLGGSSVVRTLNEGVFADGQMVALSELPKEYRKRDPFRLYALAAAHLCDFRLTEAASCLRAMERVILHDAERDLLQGRAELLWALRAGLLSDPDDLLLHYSLAVQALASSQPGSSGATISEAQAPWVDPMDRLLLAQLQVLAADAHLWRGERDAALGMLGRQRGLEDGSKDSSVMAVLARIAYEDGQLGDSLRLAGTALDNLHSTAAPDRSWSSTAS